MRIANYTKTKNALQVRILFREIYPEWDEAMLDKMSYDETHPSHIKTKIALENTLIIGQVNAFWINKEKGIANIGYHVHPTYQKRGVGYQLTKTFIDELRNEVNCFVVLTTHDNIASQMLCEKLGFTDPSDEIYNVVSATGKYKKIQRPYFKALMGNKT
jgi:RimJ/RimL family protein N-acetyltransferase